MGIFGYPSRETTTATPWDKADTVTKVTRGINFYSTPSHGGFILSQGKNNEIPEYARNDNRAYEEDCQWAIVVYFFPQYFPAKDVLESAKTLREWYPDIYERATGKTVTPEESHVVRERVFKEKNANNWVVISAVYSGNHKGYVECYATLGGIRSTFYVTVVVRKYLVKSGVYDTRNYAYVIGDNDILVENFSDPLPVAVA